MAENGSYFSYNKELEKDNYLKYSELKNIVAEVVDKCKPNTGMKPQYGEKISGWETNKLNKLKTYLIISQ